MPLEIFKRGNVQWIGILCVIAATILGVVYFTLAGAPSQVAIVNGAALLLGLVVLQLLRLSAAKLSGIASYAMLTAAIALLAASLTGQAVEGATRWVGIGPLFIQPSLIILPLMIAAFVTRRNAITTTAMLVASLAIALQPDRGMAGVLFAGLAMQAALRPNRFALIASAGGLIALIVTMLRPDNLPAIPYVDQIYFTSFEVSFLAGIAVIGGTVLLLVPAIIATRLGKQPRELGLVFGAIWAAAILAAFLGNYPTPVVGYSGAAILGYVFSLGALPSARKT